MNNDKSIHSEQRIIESLKIYYSIEVIILSLLPLGADVNASVYKAVAKDQSVYFVKLKRGAYNDINTVILELLHAEKIKEIICPLKAINGQSAQLIDDCNLIVYPFIEGQNGFSCALSDEQWLILGKVLRQIHAIDVPALLQHKLRRETYSPKWRVYVRSLYPQIEAKPSGEEIALKFLAFMNKNMTIIRRLVERAEQLAQKLQDDHSKFVLCHSDIHGGNILISENNAIYIVDWDAPIMAPKERDLMFIGGGVGNVWNKSHEEALFYKGYGKTEINTTLLAYYRHERIVEDIALFAQELLLNSTSNDADKAVTYQYFIDMFEPNGVVEIALAMP